MPEIPCLELFHFEMEQNMEKQNFAFEYYKRYSSPLLLLIIFKGIDVIFGFAL
jgi:hypothetical protein